MSLSVDKSSFTPVSVRGNVPPLHSADLKNAASLAAVGSLMIYGEFAVC